MSGTPITGDDVLVRQSVGDGNDKFIFKQVSDSGTSGSTRDQITDFDRGHDLVDLSAIDAKSGAGNQAFTFIGQSAFSGTKGELRYEKSANKTIIKGDVDGDGSADFHIQLTQSMNLNAADFVL